MSSQHRDKPGVWIWTALREIGAFLKVSFGSLASIEFATVVLPLLALWELAPRLGWVEDYYPFPLDLGQEPCLAAADKLRDPCDRHRVPTCRGKVDPANDPLDAAYLDASPGGQRDLNHPGSRPLASPVFQEQPRSGLPSGI